MEMSEEGPAVGTDEMNDDELSIEEQEKLIAETQERFRSRLLEKYGIMPEHIDKWKQQYPRVAAFPLYDDFYVIRALTRREWRNLMKAPTGNQEVSEEDMEENIAMTATLFPQLDPSALRTGESAGLATTLSRNIQMISGFVPGALPIVL